jgi:hypothetical protein
MRGRASRIFAAISPSSIGLGELPIPCWTGAGDGAALFSCAVRQDDSTPHEIIRADLLRSADVSLFLGNLFTPIYYLRFPPDDTPNISTSTITWWVLRVYSAAAGLDERRKMAVRA